MNPEIFLTILVLLLVVVLFIFEWVRVDVVGLLMMVLLPLLGLISPKQAFVGLSSDAIPAIIALFIVGAGLDKTGIMNRISRPIVKLAGKSEKSLIILISGTVGIISSMMQNIGAAALFLPAAQRVAKRMQVPVSRILMPMGFCAIIGGTLTLVGASVTILLNDLMVLGGQKLEPFGMFTQTPIGLCLLATGILYFIVFGKFVLPAGDGKSNKGITAHLMEEYRGLDNLFEVHVPEDFEGHRTLGELAVRTKFLCTVVAIRHSAEKELISVPKRNHRISAGDDLAIIGRTSSVTKLADEFGWRIKDGLEVFAESLAQTNSGMAEAIISPKSEFIGKTLQESNPIDLSGLNPVALFRGHKIFYTGLNRIRLQMGDTLLLQGPWEKFHIIRNRPQPSSLTFATPLEGEILRPGKAKLAVLWFAVVMVMIIVFKTKVPVAFMTGALGMVISGVLSIDEAYQSVDWMVVFLLSGLIPLGIAFEKTGTAAFIARTILNFIGHPSPIIILSVVGLLTSFFTLIISNVGATVLLVPLCMNLAVMAGGDPRMAALVVALSASNTFMLPTHQVNALVMRPGGYRPVDYAKAGAILTILFLGVEIAMLYFFYGIQ